MPSDAQLQSLPGNVQNLNWGDVQREGIKRMDERRIIRDKPRFSPFPSARTIVRLGRVNRIADREGAGCDMLLDVVSQVCVVNVSFFMSFWPAPCQSH